MKSKALLSAASFVLFISAVGFSGSDAYAWGGLPTKAWVYTDVNPGPWSYSRQWHLETQREVTRLNTDYGLGAVLFTDDAGGGETPITHPRLAVHVFQKRFRVYALRNPLEKDEFEDLTLKDKSAAETFCRRLTDLAKEVNHSTVDVVTATANSNINWAIAVPYWIAYDKGSEPTADGKSTPARKYVLCPNKRGWVLNPNLANDEDEKTGVLASEQRERNQYYDVHCVNGKKTSFWHSTERSGNFVKSVLTNGAVEGTFPVNFNSSPTLHQLNEQVGGKYCSLPFDGILTSQQRENNRYYDVRCVNDRSSTFWYSGFPERHNGVMKFLWTNGTHEGTFPADSDYSLTLRQLNEQVGARYCLQGYQ